MTLFIAQSSLKVGRKGFTQFVACAISLRKCGPASFRAKNQNIFGPGTERRDAVDPNFVYLAFYDGKCFERTRFEKR